MVQILVAGGASVIGTHWWPPCPDVVEDTDGTLALIHRAFGPAVAAYVAAVTKPDAGPTEAPEQARACYFARFHTAPKAVLQIKLADRLSNVQRLDTHPGPDTQRRYYGETVRFFLPLAEGEPWFARWFGQWARHFQYRKCGWDQHILGNCACVFETAGEEPQAKPKHA